MDPEDENNEPGTGTPPPPSGITQEDMTRIATREKDQGKRQGQREVLEALGLGSVEEAQQLAQALKDADAATKSEAQRAKEAAARELAAAQADRESAKLERFEARVERELLRTGIPIEQVGKVSRLVEAEVDSTPEDITTAVADLKQTMPQLFSAPGSDEESGTPKPPQSDPGKAPGQKPKSDPSARAAARLKARHGDRISTHTKE